METNGGGSSERAAVKEGEVEGEGSGARGEDAPVVEEGDQRSSSSASAITTIQWKPDERCLKMLMAMGIDRSTAMKGLYYTGNYSAEFAASYIFDNPDRDEEIDKTIKILTDLPKKDPPRKRMQCGEPVNERSHYLMAFITNGALDMDTGKVAAQVTDAALGLYRRLENGSDKFRDQLQIWEEEGEKKEFVEGIDEIQLRQLEKEALSMDCQTFTCKDRLDDLEEGAEAPYEVITLLAIFGREETVDDLIDDLPLL